MLNATYLVLGALLGGAINVVVQLHLRRVDQARARRLAVRVLFSELAEVASAKINDPSGEFDAGPLHAAWREHRAALTDLGGEDWRHLDDAVMSLVFPEQYPTEQPSSNPLTDRMDRAFLVLERHADLPHTLTGG